MYERFTDRARNVMDLARDEAQAFGRSSIGTEHVLIALAESGDDVAVGRQKGN